MFFSEINEGDGVEISFKSDDSKICYFSTVLSVHDGQKIFAISRPQNDKKNLLPIDSNTVYEVVVASKNNALACECRIIKANHEEDGVNGILLRVISPVTILHRRRHMRHECSLLVKYSPISDGQDFLSDSGEWYAGEARDISSGGIGFICDRDIDVGTMLKLLVESEGYKLLAECRVLNQHRISTIQNSDTDEATEQEQPSDDNTAEADQSDIDKVEVNAVFTAVIREGYYRNKILNDLENTQIES